MHREYKITVLIALLFSLAGFIRLSAQMSDQEVIQEVRKYENSGMSQQQILMELGKKGVTSSQLQRLRAQYEESQNSSDSGVESNYDPSDGIARDTAGTLDISAKTPPTAPEDRVYGQDFFSADNLTFSPNMNMPTPANYVLGPGDEVLIDVWGNSELNVRYTVTPDGHITVPGLGRIMLNGLTIQQAESKIRNEFASIYSDLGSSEPGTFLAISVGNVRTIKVNVMGEVTTPGTYTLSSFSSAFHALYASGGPSKIGSLRNIRIFRSGKDVATVDIYKYLMEGDNTGDISLRDGDIVMVEPYSALVRITGEIKRPMWYEMREDETLKDLIRYSGGFADKSYRFNVSLYRAGDTEMSFMTLSAAEYPSFLLHDGDRVVVDSVSDKFSNMVEISGAVERPGKYSVGDQIKTVRDLVNIALGPTGDAYLYRVLLYREQNDLQQTMESFDLEALLRGSISDIPLQKNDRLHIPSILSLEDSLTIAIEGSVRAPGNYPFALNMRIEDAILRAGGLSEEASTARIDVYRRIKDPGGTTIPDKMSKTYTFTLDSGKIVSNDPSFVLHPYDQIIVRRSPGYEPQANVTIKGEVLFGGNYAKSTREERLSSLVQRAGGLTKYAYTRGASLLRRPTPEELEKRRRALETLSRIRNDSSLVSDSVDQTMLSIGIDLEKALQNPGGSEDIIVREGDVLTIPQLINTVEISGGVMYPHTVTYKKNLKLGGYIRQAGGYSRLAMKRKPFVIYANGQVATGRWARIEPGCRIVVPEKPDREPMSLQGILGISTSIASIALLISNLVK